MRIAAVGDSVMWGQGLMPPLNPIHFEDEEKYVFKIVEWLQKEGKVQKFDMADFLAHSGAKIGSNTDPSIPPKLTRENANNKKEYDLFYGEVPDRNPAILWQLKSLQDGHTIDLLLMNGGPNDVEITESVSVFDPITDNFNEALEKIDRVAELRVSNLLSEARKTCPNAIIIYTGYYPALSPHSDIPLSVSITDIVTSVAPFSGLLGGLLLLSDVLLRTQLPRIKKQGVVFHQRILAKFREQIALFNEKRNPASPPILFCPSLVSSSNAMWGNAEMIFSIAHNSNPGVSAPRKKLCVQVYNNISFGLFESATDINKEKLTDRFICENAYIGHPNRKGAEQYYQQLKKRIEVQLNFSLRDHFKTLDPQISSLRILKEKYAFIPVSSLRGLSDFYWMDVIAVNCSFTPSDFLMAEHFRLFINTVNFDFGWGYRQITGKNGQFVLELSDNRRVNALKHLKIRYKKIYTGVSPMAITTNIELELVVQINGYQLCRIKLTRNSFKIEGAYLVWEMPVLNYKPVNT